MECICLSSSASTRCFVNNFSRSKTTACNSCVSRAISSLLVDTNNNELLSAVVLVAAVPAVVCVSISNMCGVWNGVGRYDATLPLMLLSLLLWLYPKYLARNSGTGMGISCVCTGYPLKLLLLPLRPRPSLTSGCWT